MVEYVTMVPVRQRASIILTLSHHPPHFTLNLLLHATLWGPQVTTPGGALPVPELALYRLLVRAVVAVGGAHREPLQMRPQESSSGYWCEGGTRRGEGQP